MTITHLAWGSARHVQPFRKIAELDFVFDASICDRYVDDIGTLGDSFESQRAPWATASYNVSPVTSTVWDMPSLSCIVTREDRTLQQNSIRLLFATRLVPTASQLIRFAFCFARCPLSHRLLGPFLVELTWNLRARLRFDTLDARHSGAV